MTTNAVNNKWLLALGLVALMLSGCSGIIKREDPATPIDLSGNWNDTDSQLVSQEMIADALSRTWLNTFVSTKGRKPVVIVGSIRNRSHEHINTRTFIADMERELLNSGRVAFVADRYERGEVREERADQSVNATHNTRAHRELGADFMLQGQINTIIDSEDPILYLHKQSVRFYQVDLTLVSLKNNRKVWMGQKKIKKLVKKPLIR